MEWNKSMSFVDKTGFGFSIVLLFSLFGLIFYTHLISSDASVSYTLDSSENNFVTGAVVGLEGTKLEVSTVVSEVVECWSFNSQIACNNNASLGCKWNSQGSFCERWSCFNGDGTNQTFCETTLKDSFNQSCTWSAGPSFCDPVGGNFFGNGCEDFDGNAEGCYNTGFCLWNSSNSMCNEPMGGFDQQIGFNNNPSCMVIMNELLCTGIEGCSWNAGPSTCTGNTPGIQCSNLNKTMCGDFTMLSTCCAWNGTNCTTSFDKGCYNNMQVQPTGAYFCEDYNAFKNQTLCQTIAGSPWYMPCKWNNMTNECHFNNDAFGGSSSFDDMSSETGCEAIGGQWKSEQYVDNSGAIKTDTWCEFKAGFEGGSGNCNSACWACETDVSVTQGNTSGQAQTHCENSELGYCEFHDDGKAFNGLGWCEPKKAFIEGGSKSCDSECSACEFLTTPQSMCQNSSKGCIWKTDVNAPNGEGFCFGKNEKRCDTDCFSCYDSAVCVTGNGGNGACQWDAMGFYCKPTGYTGEVCFDGKDNDNNLLIDCADSACATDKFCGGEDLAEGFGKDCPSMTPQGNNTCVQSGCQWVQDKFQATFGGAGAGFCDFPGAMCKNFDDQFPCENMGGGQCNWNTGGSNTCGKNESLFNNCFANTTQIGCSGVSGCGWTIDTYSSNGGRCEPLVFSQCMGNQTRRLNSTNCQQNYTVKGVSTQICGWTVDQFNPQGGYCDPVCFSLGGTDAACQDYSQGLCKIKSGYCEPKSFGGKCSEGNGNQTKCNTVLNASCSYSFDFIANNKVNATEPSGWCNSKKDGKFKQFMGDQPPTILGNDGADGGIPDGWDLGEIGLRDDFSNLMMGANIQDFSQSTACNGTLVFGNGLGSGNSNHTFFWYIDTDGNVTDNCVARDNSSLSGFEFSFKYQAKWSASKQEIKASYQCVNGSWGPAPIPLNTDAQKMCNLVRGGMAGIDKKELSKFKTLYNKSKDMRIYVVVTQNVVNDSTYNDTAGPYYYSPGSFDFRLEDCSNAGGDGDGDGLTASNDPDCFNFMKFGFNPSESGFLCKDGKDNDGDTFTDCVDDGCKYDTFACGGQLVANVNDKTSPKVTWLQVDTFPDGAFVMYDTNEPSNGTLIFYGNDSTCTTINKTINDTGIMDTLIPDYKLWHDGPVDNMPFNKQAIGVPLSNGSAFFYKTTVCDVSGNCGVSACLNFTTKATLSACKSCTSTFNFPFTPPTGVAASSPMGNLKFDFQMSGGGNSSVEGNAAAGTQLNYTASKMFNLSIANPNATNTTKWHIKLIDASVGSKVSSSAQNFTGGSDVQFNATVNGSFIGLGDNKCQELINAFRPKKLEIGIPGNNTGSLWQCPSSLNASACVDKASNATLVGYDASTNETKWIVPAEWGC